MLANGSKLNQDENTIVDINYQQTKNNFNLRFGVKVETPVFESNPDRVLKRLLLLET
ncbi:hypothetical protein [Altericista sp. CCNU0014]|uniref:hypothetical protein n=1 Tax=Altericista sp. CCNU0014 TaxID=3082949 RepID=UPI00385116E9